mmetsp:Transcript_31352/g.90974  ORF Transcript_31352/g.90974 Transcript_31352/m.90974 type:complete len:202 (-) Transcript_31352:2784-3389(-)
MLRYWWVVGCARPDMNDAPGCEAPLLTAAEGPAPFFWLEDVSTPCCVSLDCSPVAAGRWDGDWAACGCFSFFTGTEAPLQASSVVPFIIPRSSIKEENTKASQGSVKSSNPLTPDPSLSQCLDGTGRLGGKTASIHHHVTPAHEPTRHDVPTSATRQPHGWMDLCTYVYKPMGTHGMNEPNNQQACESLDQKTHTRCPSFT